MNPIGNGPPKAAQRRDARGVLHGGRPELRPPRCYAAVVEQPRPCPAVGDIHAGRDAERTAEARLLLECLAADAERFGADVAWTAARESRLTRARLHDLLMGAEDLWECVNTLYFTLPEPPPREPPAGNQGELF